MTLLVGASDALKRQSPDGGVREVAVDTHEHSLCRLECACLKYHSRHLHRVDGVAGGEVDGKSVKLVGLVQVLYCIGEVDGIGHVGDQGVAQLHGHFFPVGGDRRDVFLCRRNHNLVHDILHLHIFIECDGDFIAFKIGAAYFRVAPYIFRRVNVIVSSCGAPYGGARRQDYPDRSGYKPSHLSRFIPFAHIATKLRFSTKSAKHLSKI